MRFFKKILFVSFLVNSFIRAENRTFLEKGTMYLSGDLTGNYERINWQKGKNHLSLNSSFNLGYFLGDNFSMGLGFPVIWNFIPASFGVLGLKLSANTFLGNKNMLIPYFGLDLNPKLKLIKEDNEFLLSTGFTFGAILSLSDSVALDLGIRPELFYKLNPKQNWQIQIPFGFLGVRAFF